MTEYINAAARLASVMEKVRDARSDNAALPTWISILGIDEELFPNAIVDLHDQLRITKLAVGELNENEAPHKFKPYLETVHGILNNLLSVQSVPMRDYSDQVDGELILGLQMCSGALQRNGIRDPEVNADGLVDLLDLVGILKEEVELSDLPADLKIILLKHLATIEIAIYTIKFGGYAKLQDAMDLLTGASIRVAHHAKPEDGRRVLKWVGRLWVGLQNSAQGVKTITASVEAVNQAIESISN